MPFWGKAAEELVGDDLRAFEAMKKLERNPYGKVMKARGRIEGALEGTLRSERMMKMPKLQRAATAISRHPYATGGLIGGWAAAQALHGKFGRMGGPQASARNQNNMWLKSMRNSSGSQGLQGGSSGGFTM